MEQNDNKKSKFLILSIAGTVLGFIIIVALIIGGALLASKKWDPKWNPFRQKVDKNSILRTY